MTQVSLDGTIGRAIAAYTGKELVNLEVVPDPNMPAFAAWATVVTRLSKHTARIDELYFLIKVPLDRVTAEDLEEVEFTAWPPEVKR